METALALAARGLGRVWPNPSVGCVIVKDGVIAGRGWTGEGGRPHAEEAALKRAGRNARGARVYLTLEPCAGRSRGLSCAERLIRAGVAEVVAAVRDPDPRTFGRGFARLKESGIRVRTGLMEREARDLNIGFFKRTLLGFPFVTLKIAASSDGKIAPATGKRAWITGKAARAFGHRLRASHDAILTGVGTVLADDPELTCRLPGAGARSPVRVILDSTLRTPKKAKIFRTKKKAPVWMVYSPEKVSPGLQFSKGIGYTPVTHPRDLRAVLEELAKKGITRVLVEGGGKVNASFLSSGFVDRIAWFSSNSKLGAKAVPAFAGKPKILGPGHIPGFETVERHAFGADSLEILQAID